MWDWLPWRRKKPEPPKFGGAGASGDFTEPPQPAVRLPRGIRNRNPFNIETGPRLWVGQVGDDGRFCKFIDPHHGIRAGCVLLINYGRKYGLRTIQGIISRFAPSTENNTAAYVAAVSRDTHFPATKTLDTENIDVLVALASAIIRHENGYNPYDPETIRGGANAALRSVS